LLICGCASFSTPLNPLPLHLFPVIFLRTTESTTRRNPRWPWEGSLLADQVFGAILFLSGVSGGWTSPPGWVVGRGPDDRGLGVCTRRCGPAGAGHGGAGHSLDSPRAKTRRKARNRRRRTVWGPRWGGRAETPPRGGPQHRFAPEELRSQRPTGEGVCAASFMTVPPSLSDSSPAPVLSLGSQAALMIRGGGPPIAGAGRRRCSQNWIVGGRPHRRPAP